MSSTEAADHNAVPIKEGDARTDINASTVADDADEHDNEGNNKNIHRYTSYGRPLSIIESSHSASSDEGDHRTSDAASAYIDIEPDATKRRASSTELEESAIDSHRTSPPSSMYNDEFVGMADDLEEQIIELFGQHAHDSDTEAAVTTMSEPSIRIKYLPGLLDQFERVSGTRLLGTLLRSQLDAFAKGNPDVAMQPRTFAEMIRQLHKAGTDGNDSFTTTLPLNQDFYQDAADVSNELRHVTRTRNLTDSGASSYDSSESSSEERDDLRSIDHPADALVEPSDSSSPSSHAKQHCSLAFPRSQSERADLSSERFIEQNNAEKSTHEVRKYTTSDPLTPLPQHRRASAPMEGQTRTARKIHKRSSESGNDDREVLKGKGKVKAPPSAWSRPKPQALVSRDRTRKLSDTSAKSTSQDSEYERQFASSSPPASPTLPESQVNSFTDNQTGIVSRQRLSSQPNLSSNNASPPLIPRSVSSTSTSGTFMFPRAASPTDTPGRRSGTVSPSLDEASYYNFSVISPTYDGSNYFPRTRSVGSRHSSGAGRRRGDSSFADDTLTSGEHVAALQAQLEALQRTLSEKNRSIDQLQRESEEYIARLQDELDRARSDLSLRRKEDALNKIRENNHLDSIASLEADLTKTSGELDTLRVQHARLRSDHDDLLAAMERQTARSYEFLETINKARTEIEAHTDSERQWDMDRETYRETIKELHDEINTIQQKLMGREEDVRVIAMMQASIDALTAELEETRVRGSNFFGGSRAVGGSENATLSKRLGAELARSMGQQDGREGDNAGDENDIADIDGDGASSRDSVFVIRRHRRGQPVGSSGTGDAARTIDLTDASCQTAEPEEAVPDVGDQSMPPTYDEAKLEREVSLRLHPSWSPTPATLQLDLHRNEMARDYNALAEQIGTRCTHFEQQLQQRSREQEDAAEGERLAASTLTSPSWLHQVVKTFLAKMARPQSAVSEASDRSSVLRQQRSKQQFRPAELFSYGSVFVFVFLSGLLLGLCLLTALAPSNGDGVHNEDKQAWRDSNTLQVPWTGDAGRYDAGQWAIADAEPLTDQRNLLLRLFGGQPIPKGSRTPT